MTHEKITIKSLSLLLQQKSSYEEKFKINQVTYSHKKIRVKSFHSVHWRSNIIALIHSNLSWQVGELREHIANYANSHRLVGSRREEVSIVTGLDLEL